ncbi:MAG: OmpH family outer membrane protein [Saprospirales bacterium]|nr:OmpH family outer membrane protein [Saprospirales bacterium]MBK8489455.1 OmpH family outer membrane protein [Saprospirales bacterium]
MQKKSKKPSLFRKGHLSIKCTKPMRNALLAFGLFIFFLSGTQLSAQRMGYTNSLLLLNQMPEIAQADTAIMVLRDSLLADGESRAKLLQEKYLKYMEEAQKGILTPVESQKREAEIQKGQDDLQQYEQQIKNWLSDKREVLYGPVLEKLQQAIDEVGKENGFQFIFDVSSLNIIVYAEESEDVTPLIKAKLGLE